MKWKEQALLIFHALTSCNMVSCFTKCRKSVNHPTLADPDTYWPLQCTETCWWRCHAQHWEVCYSALCRNKCHNQAHHKLFAKKSNVQLIPLTSVSSNKQYIIADMSGARPWFLHQHCYQPPRARSRPATYMNLFVQQYSNSAERFSPANVSRAASRSSSARRPVWNAHHCVLIKRSALGIKLTNLKGRFRTVPDSTQVL